MAFSPDSEVNIKPRVMIVGGPDVDARLDLMGVLADDFDFVVAVPLLPWLPLRTTYADDRFSS